MSSLERLARLRVPLGFACGAAALWFAEPTSRSIAAGVPVAAAGEALRIWAAGHLQKGREVTRSGPYRYTRHPLYLGSTIIGAGLALAAWSAVTTAIIVTYLTLTLTAAIRTEELHLRRKFGVDYDAYARGAVDATRRFDAALAWQNREYRALVGLAAGTALVVLKAWMG
jgi:protein-S-isoprenylcysteine O-methyltransferase Ste14